MATKRNTGQTTEKLINNSQKGYPKWGTKKSSVGHFSSLHRIMESAGWLVVDVCRRIVFVNTSIKVAVYILSILLLSITAYVVTIPKFYFSRSDNILNQYFVKLGWAWTLLATLPFNMLTCWTLSRGNKLKVLQHASRIIVATFMWYFCTNSFVAIQEWMGTCSNGNYSTEDECLKFKSQWQSLDLSGHTFILIYSALVIIEEARPINGWKKIKESIIEEEQNRAEGKRTSNLLHSLNDEEFNIFKEYYYKFTPIVQGLFVLMCILVIIWDFMLIFTQLYFHTIVEKLVAGLLAVSVWFLTYRGWYAITKISPSLPGKYLLNSRNTNIQRIYSIGTSST